MKASQNQKTLAIILKKCGLDNQTIIILTIALKNNQQKMNQVVDYILEQEKANAINSDKIARKIMEIITNN